MTNDQNFPVKDTDGIVLSVCLCTYHRPEMLTSCLGSLLHLEFPSTLEVVVVDNDSSGSAAQVVGAYAAAFRERKVPIVYASEPQQGIASARNHAVALARGEFIAFIDDDEIAAPMWLTHLHKILVRYGADAVWGPVLPIFPENFPEWQKSFFARSRRPTGSSLATETKGTGNALIKRGCLMERQGPFDIALNRIGGSDTDLFTWLSTRGKVFVWCDEAVVYETQPFARTKIRWHLIRAYRGGWGFSHQKTKYMGRGKAFIVVLSWVPLAAIKNMMLALTHRNPRTIFLAWCRVLSTQAGKLGYFFGRRVEEYRSE